MRDGSPPIITEIEEHKRVWHELWLMLAEGDPIKYKEIKRMSAINEFWIFLNFWKKRQKEKLNNISKNGR